jgi:hypothetical protein
MAERRSALPAMSRAVYWLAKLSKLRVEHAPATGRGPAAAGRFHFWNDAEVLAKDKIV